MCWLKRRLQLGFFVRSTEIVPCPCCVGRLKIIGSRKRAWYQSSGERSKIVIRRLQCVQCKKIHHELPDQLVPYKRYDAESLEGVMLSEPKRTDVVADESTITRWRCWFLAWGVYAQGVLHSLSIRFNLPVEPLSEGSQSVLQTLGRYVGTRAGWLRKVVRSIANSHQWVTDPFRLLDQ